MYKNNNTDIMVSVCCITYNHEKYIRECLEGFVMQKTDFEYEIIINDDASTDRTADIIREYEKRYSNVLKGIYHTENQYSKGVCPEKFPFLAAKGKYIAMCEGDDYWSDPHKLQKQFDAMELNNNCHMCVHKVKIVSENGSTTGKYYAPEGIETGVIASRDFLRLICDKYCVHTSSYFTIAKDMQEYISNPPGYTHIVEEAGDEKKFLYFGQLGDVYYFNDAMSCRRELCIGSWTSQHSNLSWEHEYERIRDLGEMMKSYDIFTGYRFHDICQNRIDGALVGQFGILVQQKQYKKLLQKEYKTLRKNWSWKYRAYVLIGAYCPWILKILHIDK